MTAADKRILEQLDRWLNSVELHLKYVDLDDASYRQVQAWPEHERPARWILELAQQKIMQLKTLCKAHMASKDESFAEALEIMAFLANLVGAQNIKRSIPVADAAREQRVAVNVDADVTREAPRIAPKAPDDNATREVPQIKVVERDQRVAEPTQEMPRLKVASKKPVAATSRSSAEVVSKRVAAKPVIRPDPAAAIDQTGINRPMQEVVVADAVRLLKWGRQWHELVELIARMAERPAASEVRRILRTHKEAIEAQSEK